MQITSQRMEWEYYTNRSKQRKIDNLLQQAATLFANCDNTHDARVTAKNAEIARLQIILAYGDQFDVMDGYSDINPPHQISGEIDCSYFPETDMDWLKSRVNL